MELGNLVFGNSRGQYCIPRHEGWENVLWVLFDALGCEGYGINFENETFWIMPYYWGGCECGSDEHEPECLKVKDNFCYNPTGFGLQWYKYPFRDSYMNQQIELEQFRGIINTCIASLGKTDD